jgi:hypothetical protein
VSRADLVIEIGKPNREACRKILVDTVEGIAKAYPGLARIIKDRDFERAAELSEGLDGRKLRKLVASACAFNKETALDPGKLTANDILRAVQREKTQK